MGKKLKQEYEIIYSLNEVSDGIYTPTAFLALLNEEGFPTYAEHKATLSNLTTYNVQLTAVDQKAFALMQLLDQAYIEEKFNPSRRIPRSLKEMTGYESLQKQIMRYVHQKLDEFITLLEKNDMPLCLGLEQGDWVANKQVLYTDTELMPDLFFKKTYKGVHYQLRLDDGEEILEINKDNTHVLTNYPAWLIFNDELFRLKNINGNMVKPFLKKEEVFIPRDFVRTYFQKFIVKIASKTQISSEGFEVIQHEQLTNAHITLVKNFMNETFGIALYFFYDKARFSFGDSQETRSELDFGGKDIIIHQFIREVEREDEIVDFLEEKGLEHRVGKYFDLGSDATTPYALFNWLMEHKDRLAAIGVKVVQPEIDQKKVNLSPSVSLIHYEKGEDWFDLKGTVKVGQFTIPFARFATYILEKKPFFPLADGSYFLIPEEWFSKYEAVVQMGKLDNQVIRLTKSQFPLLQALDLEAREADVEEEVVRTEVAVQEAQKVEKTVPEITEEVKIEYEGDLKATLRPYQEEGVKWLIHLHQHQLGGLLADDMGLGKTLQTIAILLYAKKQKAKRLEKEGEDEESKKTTAKSITAQKSKKAIEELIQEIARQAIAPPVIVQETPKETVKDDTVQEEESVNLETENTSNAVEGHAVEEAVTETEVVETEQPDEVERTLTVSASEPETGKRPEAQEESGSPQTSAEKAYLESLKEVTNSVPLTALIIMPASLIFNWEAEIKKFAPNLMIYKHLGSKRHDDPRILKAYDIILTTYHTALNDTSFLQQIEFEYVVLDESQQIKNRESLFFKAMNSLKARYKLSLTGTPIENSLSDLWAQMQFINPDLLGEFSFFKKEFLQPIEKNNNPQAKARLSQLTGPYILRRKKENVAQDLPPLTEQIFYSEMLPDQRKKYEKAKAEARNYLLNKTNQQIENFNAEIFRTLLKLRQIAIHPQIENPRKFSNSGKFRDILEHLTMAEQSGHKTLIFSQFVEHLKLYPKYFEARNWRYSMLTGSTSPNMRESAVRQFEENPSVKQFLISLKAGGTGLNLTSADYVFITDPWWNPQIEKQAIARAHRIGQKKSVIAIRFITKDSIEEKIMQLQARKNQLSDDILDAADHYPFEMEDLNFLLE